MRQSVTVEEKFKLTGWILWLLSADLDPVILFCEAFLQGRKISSTGGWLFDGAKSFFVDRNLFLLEEHFVEESHTIQPDKISQGLWTQDLNTSKKLCVSGTEFRLKFSCQLILLMLPFLKWFVPYTAVFNCKLPWTGLWRCHIKMFSINIINTGGLSCVKLAFMSRKNMAQTGPISRQSS